MLKDVLQKLRVSDLQNEIRKVLADFKGFKNMKKSELIEVMLENESLFKHLDKVDTTEFKKKTVPKPKGKIQKQREEDKPVKEKLKKEPTEYVKFVKQYRMKNNLSLKDAMKEIKEKGLYKAKSPAKPKVKLSKEEQVKKEDKKSRNNIRKKLVEYEKTVTDDPKTRDKTQFLKLKKIIGKKTPFQKKKRRMLRKELPKMYEKLKELNFFEDIDIEKEESKSVKKEEKLKDDDFSYLGITNEEAEELLGIKKKTPSKKLSLDEMIKKNKQFKQDIKDLEEQKRTVKKTSEVADRIRSEIVDLKEKSIALERQIFEAKDKLENENIKQKKIDEEKEEERELLEFKINVEKFIKKPTEELNDKILDNLDYIDELSQKDQDRLNKALDKFEKGEEEPEPAPKKKEPKKEEPKKQPKKGLLTDSEYNKLKAELSEVPDVLNYYNDLKKVLKEKTEELKKNKTLSLKEKEIELKLEYENIKKNVKDNNLENYSFSSKNEFYLKIFKLKLEAEGGAGGFAGQTTKNSKTEKAQEELDKIPQKEISLYNEIRDTPSVSINNDLYFVYRDSVKQFETSSLDLRSNIKEYGNEEDKKIMRKKIPFNEKQKLLENNFKKSKPAPKPKPKKKQVNKKTEEPKKEQKKETTNKLKAIVQKVKPGDPRFVANFQKLSRQGQLKAMLKQIEITGQPLKKEEYQEMADKFYNGIFSTLSKSASRAIPEIINNYHLPLSALEILYQGQDKGTKIDFYPTPKKCIDTLINALPLGFKPKSKGNNRNEQTKILEGTAGIGNVAYFINQINPNYVIQANEMNEGLYSLMRNFLPSEIKTTNDDFFDINENYDIIFLNPPFGSVSQGTANFFFKFLLHSLKILNDNKGGYIMFISPPLIKFKEDSKGKLVFGEDQYSQISNFFKSQNKENGILPDTMIKYINELNNTNYSKKDFSKVLTILNNYELLPEDADIDLEELYNLIEDDYSFSYGSVVGACEGFGGTGTRAQMNLIQVMK